MAVADRDVEGWLPVLRGEQPADDDDRELEARLGELIAADEPAGGLLAFAEWLRVAWMAEIESVPLPCWCGATSVSRGLCRDHTPGGA